MIYYNPTYDALYAPVQGPENPFKTQHRFANQNHLTGNLNFFKKKKIQSKI